MIHTYVHTLVPATITEEGEEGVFIFANLLDPTSSLSGVFSFGKKNKSSKADSSKIFSTEYVQYYHIAETAAI